VPLHHVGYREEGARVEPARDVVARRVVVQRLGRDVEYLLLHILQVADTHDGLEGRRVAYDEISESEVVHDGVSQVDRQLLGVLVDEYAAERPDGLGVGYLGGLDDDGQIRVALAEICAEPQAGLLVLDALAGERHVADDAEHLAAELLVQFHGFLVSTGEHHLGASAHTQHLLMLVEGLGGEEARLLEEELIDVRKDRRIEADGVLDHEDALHAHVADVVGIELVLKELDDGQQQVEIAEPAEDIVHVGEVLHGQTPRHFLAERGKHHKGHGRELGLEKRRAVERVGQVAAGHGYDEVESLLPHHLQRLGHIRHTDDTRRRTQVKGHVLIVQLLLDTSVLFHHESIVRRGYQQHIEYAMLHK